METREQITMIHSALHMREEVWNETEKRFDQVLSIQGQQRELLKSRLVDLILSLGEE